MSADDAGPSSLGTAVADLYSLLPAEFTAARNAKAAAAGKAGNKDLATRIKALPKPSTAAWLVNLLAHQRQEELGQVLELGAALREAQEDLDQKQLRRLSTERQRLLRAIIRDARDLAAELDHPVSETLAGEAEQTLWAAMTDPSAADVVASGQLVRSLAASGWEEVDLDGAVADPDSVPHGAGAGSRTPAGRSAKDTSGSKGGSQDSAAVRRRQAEAQRAVRTARVELDEAAGAEQQAQEALDTAQRAVDESAGHRDELTDEIDELRERIRQLEREVSAVDRRSGKLERERDQARRASRSARRTAEKARQKLADAENLADDGS
ncbi:MULTISPECIES: hypothetical protein [unclassified Arthrobacter]|uniref:hypothetical protein n=1 Tax=unclassified Arthrobacter TaxID=235627 RepID=UPI001E467024|nr:MULTISPECIES: hypothetical protein [unclassified Arthrobacter]MCC9145818.1 hypothetical protein [Arthrobacter sp. zg-Y919]MDK1277047.1 hypothetical protein [Arthrobacter sp. zg.Y919]WIB03576.1 hypothetical protein QNO10_02495 [Arthrobacter sp. zg-Y919]